MVHGSEDLKRRFLAPIYRGDVFCSQLLSEPEAGSDLAGLKTRAVRDGDEWVVNGQKVWSSFAHRAKIGQLMARTDPDVPKHQGLTMFLLPTRHAGRRDPPAAPDERPGRVQRGVPHRRARARRQPRRRAGQWLAGGADDADVGAGLGRRRQVAVGQPGDDADRSWRATSARRSDPIVRQDLAECGSTTS